VELGTLTLHRPNGDEVFRLSKATIRALPKDEDVVLYLYVNTDETSIKTLPNTEDLNAWPNAEVTIRVPRSQFGSLVGRRFSVPKSWDEDARDHVSCIYYCEHEDLNDNEVEFLEVSGDALKVRWTGTMTDDYDAGEPDHASSSSRGSRSPALAIRRMPNQPLQRTGRASRLLAGRPCAARSATAPGTAWRRPRRTVRTPRAATRHVG
jgi:hypothetical protein